AVCIRQLSGSAASSTPSMRHAGSGLCAVDPAALALEERTRLDRQGLVHDVADQSGRLRQNHRLALDLPVDRTADPNAVAGNASAHVRALADRDRAALDVALYFAVDLNVAVAHEIALDLQITADDRRRRVAVAVAVAPPHRVRRCSRHRLRCGG